MGYVSYSDLEDMKLGNLKKCFEKAWNKFKNFIIEISEYDLYRGTKWDDY